MEGNRNINILIINSSSFTIGDIGITDCMINQIKRVMPGSNIVIESANPSKHSTYFINQNIKFIQRLFDVRDIDYARSYLSFNFLFKNYRLISKYAFDALELLLFALLRFKFTKREIFHEFLNADIIISAGGDAITKNYGFFLRVYTFLLLKLMGKKVIIYASTIGPFTGLSKFLVSFCLKKIDLILARDKKSYNFLLDSGVSKDIVKNTADCVILLESSFVGSAKDDITRLGITKKSVGIFLKANAFSDVSDGEYAEYLENINITTNKLFSGGYSVVFLAANDTDYKISLDFFQQIQASYPIINLMNFSCGNAKYLLSNFGIVVTSRMHPAILASTSLVPVIGISNETKMLEYLELIGIPDLHLKQVGLSSDCLIKLIYENINNSEVIERLKINIKEAQSLSKKNIEYLDSWVEQEYGQAKHIDSDS